MRRWFVCSDNTTGLHINYCNVNLVVQPLSLKYKLHENRVFVQLTDIVPGIWKKYLAQNRCSITIGQSEKLCLTLKKYFLPVSLNIALLPWTDIWIGRYRLSPYHGSEVLEGNSRCFPTFWASLSQLVFRDPSSDRQVLNWPLNLSLSCRGTGVDAYPLILFYPSRCRSGHVATVSSAWHVRFTTLTNRFVKLVTIITTCSHQLQTFAFNTWV